MGPRHQNLHSTTHWAATLDGRTYEEVEAFLVPACWMLIAMVVAVRHALDYTSTARALGVAVTMMRPSVAPRSEAKTYENIFRAFGRPCCSPIDASRSICVANTYCCFSTTTRPAAFT